MATVSARGNIADKIPEKAFEGGVQRPEGRVQRGAGHGRLPDANHAAAVVLRHLALVFFGNLRALPDVRVHVVDCEVVVTLREPA